MKPVKVNVVKAMKDVTLKVKITGVRSMVIRRWIGVKLISLAALVMNCKTDIKEAKG